MSSYEISYNADDIRDIRCRCSCAGVWKFKDKTFYCRREMQAYAKGFVDGLREVSKGSDVDV